MVEIYGQHPDILLLDCTYKTNRYNIPLLNICGVTSNNKNIALGCAFLENEQADGAMKWSLNCIRAMFDEFQIPLPRVIVHDRAQSLINALEEESSSFKGVPHLLCRWHQNKCVLAWLQKDGHGFGGTYRINGQRVNSEGVMSGMEIYMALVNSKTEHEFDELLQKLHNRPEQH